MVRHHYDSKWTVMIDYRCTKPSDAQSRSRKWTMPRSINAQNILCLPIGLTEVSLAECLIVLSDGLLFGICLWKQHLVGFILVKYLICNRAKFTLCNSIKVICLLVEQNSFFNMVQYLLRDIIC